VNNLIILALTHLLLHAVMMVEGLTPLPYQLRQCKRTV